MSFSRVMLRRSRAACFRRDTKISIASRVSSTRPGSRSGTPCGLALVILIVAALIKFLFFR